MELLSRRATETKQSELVAKVGAQVKNNFLVADCQEHPQVVEGCRDGDSQNKGPGHQGEGGVVLVGHVQDDIVAEEVVFEKFVVAGPDELPHNEVTISDGRGIESRLVVSSDSFKLFHDLRFFDEVVFKTWKFCCQVFDQALEGLGREKLEPEVMVSSKHLKPWNLEVKMGLCDFPELCQHVLL